jgi:hypothetical protein
MGGKDNCEIDQQIGDASLQIGPDCHDGGAVAAVPDPRGALCGQRVWYSTVHGCSSLRQLSHPLGRHHRQSSLRDAVRGVRKGRRSPLHPRSQDEIRVVFDKYEMVDPGFVPITQWRADDADLGETRPISAYCAVAKRP